MHDETDVLCLRLAMCILLLFLGPFISNPSYVSYGHMVLDAIIGISGLNSARSMDVCP